MPEIKKGSNCLKPLLALREPDWIRTNDLLLRRQLLYPAELPVQKKKCWISAKVKKSSYFVTNN